MTDNTDIPTDVNASPACPVRKLVWGGVLVLLVAMGFRFIGLGQAQVWEDEVWAYIASGELIQNQLHWQTPGNPENSPLPWIELKFVRQVLGDSGLAMRVPSAAYGAMSVLLFYLLLARFVGWRVAVISALLLAANPFMVEWTRNARMYGHQSFWTILTTIVAAAAVYRASDRKINWLDWRWWLLGTCWMFMHATQTQSLFTVLAIGLWVGAMGLFELARRSGAGLHIIGGAAVASFVYLTSWALTGIGKMIVLMNRGGRSEHIEEPDLMASIQGVITELSGNVPLWWGALLWLVATIGFVYVAMRGKGRFVLLMAMVSLVSWLSFPIISQKHFFAPRYLWPAMFGLSMGLGAMIAWLCEQKREAWQRWAGVGVSTALIGISVFLWLPSLHDSFTTSRMQMATAFDPIRQHSTEGEVVIHIPDWYVGMQEYSGYDFGQATVIRPPEAGQFTVRPTGEPGSRSNPYHHDFYELFGDDRNADLPNPPAAWLFMVSPDEYLSKADEMLEAYGLNTPEHKAKLAELAKGAQTLTVRISEAGFDHVVTTQGRKR